MKAEEPEGAGKIGFFSKIKRTLTGVSELVTPDEPLSSLVADSAPVKLSDGSPTDPAARNPAILTMASRPTAAHPSAQKAPEPSVALTANTLVQKEEAPRKTAPPLVTPRTTWLLPEGVTSEEPLAETLNATVLNAPMDTSDESLSDVSDPTGSPREPFVFPMAENLKSSLDKLMQIDGALAVALVDSNSGMAMGMAGNPNINLEVAAAGNSEVVRAKLKTMKALGLNENIEDILISLNTQYHLIRPLAKDDGVFIYLMLNRTTANLAMARHKLASAEKELEF